MTKTRRPRVLICCDYYLPGYRAGGPITTLRNVIDQLGGEFEFYLVSRNHDLGDNAPYPIPVNEWHEVGQARVRYIPANLATMAFYSDLLRTLKPDVLYLNSVLSRRFSLFPLIAHRLISSNASAVLAPRGEFASAALGLKKWRKRLYLAAAKFLGLWRNVTWQASSEFEEVDVRRMAGARAVVRVAPDFVARPARQVNRAAKQVGEANLAFVGRISPMKNIAGALAALRGIRGLLTISLYGPIEDEAYWQTCISAAAALPPNIQFVHKGAIPSDEVSNVLAQADALLLPSLGENFGQVVPEALAAGCPAIVSNRTPWRNLDEKEVGWVVPIDPPKPLQSAVNELIAMDEERHQAMRHRARAYAGALYQSTEAIAATRQLLTPL